jgi:hypothetical protein
MFSGNARTFPFSHDIKRRSEEILKSYNDYLFTDEFKSKYDYKIYITSDDLDIKNTIKYFTPEKIGNIHLTNTDYFFKPITKKIPCVTTFLNKYNKINFGDHRKYENSIHQHYKILDCYNLFRNDDITPTFLIRLRTDTVITKNILGLLGQLENDNLMQIICKWDWMAVGKPEIMKCYCTGLENKYGTYKFNTVTPKILPIMHDYNEVEKTRWTYAPERQLFEMLFEYCNTANIDINKSILSSECTNIVR